MNLFINELSFQAQAHDKTGANQLMDKLVSVYRSLKPLQEEGRVQTSKRLWEKELLNGYTVNQWAAEIGRSSIDKMRWFLIMVRKGPFIETILDDELEGYYECLLENDKEVSYSSLAGAAFLNGILISLCHCDEYNSEKISLRYRLNEGSFAEIDIANFYNPTLSEKFAGDFIEQRIKSLVEDVTSWDDFWANKEILYSRLSFCDCVRDQLNNLDFAPCIKIINTHLERMNEYCGMLASDENIVPEYHKMGILASTESGSTLSTYGYQRKFNCPDGKERLFDWHSKQLGQNIRIHFYPPDSGNNDFIVGYIGLHLKTIKYK